jgi:hypothetical protein
MTEAQIAAAFALASIGTQPAMAAIQRGLRTLNTRVRDACKKALAREFATDSSVEITPGGTVIPKSTTGVPTQPVKVPTGPLTLPNTRREPTGDLRVPSKRIPAEPTPVAPKPQPPSAVADSAPDFTLSDIAREATPEKRIPIPQEKTVPTAPNPTVGRVSRTAPIRDEIPMNMPSAPDPSRYDRTVPVEPPTMRANPADMHPDEMPEWVPTVHSQATIPVDVDPEPLQPEALIFEDPVEQAQPVKESRPPPKGPPPPPPKTGQIPLPRFEVPEAKTERAPLPPRVPLPQPPPARTRTPSESPRPSPSDDWAASIPPPPGEQQSGATWAADLTLDPIKPRKR